jgi:hypothetical protein
MIVISTGTLADIARELGAREVKEKVGKVTCSCLLSRWTHYSGSDSKPSMVIYQAGQHGEPIYKCMGCHEEGSLRDLVMELWAATGRNYMHLVMAIDGDSGPPPKASARALSVPDDPGFRKRAFIETLQQKKFNDGKPFYDYKSIAEAEQAPEIPDAVFAPYRGSIPRYAIQRGLTVETCKEWDLGHDREGKRLLFPIRDHKNRLVAISGRLYATECLRCGGLIARGRKDHDGKRIRDACTVCGLNEPPKYLHTDGFKRNLVLYGEHRRDNVDGNVFLVEGHLDMLMLWQHGYRPVVSMLGSAPGRCQIEKLIAYWGRQITVVPDGDKAGEDMVVKVKQFVADRVSVQRRKLPDKADPASVLLALQRQEISESDVRSILGDPTVRVDSR